MPLNRVLFSKIYEFLFLVIVCCVLVASPILAQEEAAEVNPISDATSDPLYAAHVIVEGEELFVVRGSSALPANERAEKAAQRIIDFAENSGTQPITMKIENSPLGKTILANGRLMAVTTEADSELEQLELEVLSQLHAEAIKKAILDYRAGRTEGARVDSVVEALIWTAGFIIVVFLMVRLLNHLPTRVAAYVEKKFIGTGKVTNDMVNSAAMGALVRYALRMVLLIILLFMTYYYLSLVLSAFAETKPIAQLLITYLTDPLFAVVSAIVNYLPNLIALALIAAVARFILTGVRLFFENVEAGTIRLKDFEKHWCNPTFNIVRVIVVLIAIVIGFPYIPGSDSEAFQGLAILVGLMVSLGSNSVIANALSGLFVIYRRSTNIGDRIKIGEHIGDVVQIKLMETHIKSIKNELISIPNAQLLNSEVINYSTIIDGRGLLLHSTVGIGYEEPQDKIEAMLIEAANRTRSILKSPEPFVLWIALADYAINYQINGYTTRGSRLIKTKSDLHRNIVDVFNENKVQIMTPSYMADTEIPKIPEQEWDGILQGVKAVSEET